MTSTDSPIDERKHLLTQWVAQELKRDPHAIELKSIASDAGFRRYFRFAAPSEWLAVDAPPRTEDSRQFIDLARYLSAHNVQTPTILAADDSNGFLLVEDFGDELLHRHLLERNPASLYRKVFNCLIQLQGCPDKPDLIPRYDRDLLRRELNIFIEWFVEKLLGYSLKQEEIDLLDDCFHKLEDSALEQPQTLVHRDFHSRNLLLRSDESLGVIDFQGALWGGCTYDLVSLLRDCYISWPIELTIGLALEYREKAINAKLLDESVDEKLYLRWFNWMGLQRHIKVLGIFARLHLRDGKSGYLKDLPLVIKYTLDVADHYQELNDFSHWFRDIILTRCKTQSWYSDISSQEDQ